MKTFAIWLLITAISLRCYAQQSLQGKVYDVYTQTPVKGAEITAAGKVLAITDVTGNFSINYNNRYEFAVTAAGYGPQSIHGSSKQLMIGLTAVIYNLDAVTVHAGTAPNLSGSKSVALLTRQELQRNDGLFLENALNLVPGVRMEKRTMSGGQRITIRGYGNNTNFNGTGYKAYLNGIPVTDAEGTTILDDIDFSILGRVEVIKGPASSLYGSGIGGVLKMFTLKPASPGTHITQEALAGSNGLFRTGIYR
jgi:iron complex outermembrane receptor protein